MKPVEQRRRAINEQLGILLQYRASQGMAELVKMLDVLVDDTLADLAKVTPEGLQLKQGAVAQLLALRKAIVDPGEHSSPKV